MVAVDLHYRKMGAGPALVVIHGLFGSADNWQTLAKQWSENYTLYLLDMRNHGRSPWADTFDYPSMAEDVRHFCEVQGIEEAYFIGHSMGGKVAMHLAVLHSELVKALMVVDIAPKSYPVHHDIILDGLEDVFHKTLTSRAEAEEILQAYISENDTKQFLLKSLYRKEDGSFGWRINVPVIDKNIESIGAAIPDNNPYNGPVKFIKGAKSGYIQQGDEALIQKIFPSAKVIIIPGAGHWVHAEQPAALHEEVVNFFLV